jgi:5-(aminomethyl)-3-furanmethanol phosphate kinase
MARVRPDAVLKVGGSLCRQPRQVRHLIATLGTLAAARTLVVVPGGGLFAEEVRRADRRFGLDPSASHWMAILAMDQTAYVLTQFARGAVVVRRPQDLRPGRLNVLAPSAWLLEADPLPHSWSVTSDSIAAWVARVLRARRLVLLKSVDGIVDSGSPDGGIRARVMRDQLGEIVDEHFARALPADIPCWIVSGARPERVATLLATGSTYGTEVIARARPRDRGDGGRAPRRARR